MLKVNPPTYTASGGRLGARGAVTGSLATGRAATGRRALLVGAVATGALFSCGLFAAPASAATGIEPIAFTVLDGTLAITPGTAAAGATSALVGGSTGVTVGLGLTTVTDTRINSAGWSVGAATTDFALTQAPGATAQVIAMANAKFSVPLAPVGVVGTPAATFTRRSAPTAVDASGNLASLVVATATGVNTATFSPQLDIAVPNGSATGAYTATVTQTVV